MKSLMILCLLVFAQTVFASDQNEKLPKINCTGSSTAKLNKSLFAYTMNEDGHMEVKESVTDGNVTYLVWSTLKVGEKNDDNYFAVFLYPSNGDYYSALSWSETYSKGFPTNISTRSFSTDSNLLLTCSFEK